MIINTVTILFGNNSYKLKMLMTSKSKKEIKIFMPL